MSEVLVPRREMLALAGAPVLRSRPLAALAGMPWAYASASPLMSARAREVAGNTVYIGQSAARSGGAAALGDEMYWGMRAAFEEANRAGGVHGRKFVALPLDDGYEPQRCVNNTLELLKRDVFGLCGYVGTPTCAAALPIIHDAGVPLVGMFTGAEALRTPRPGIFHVRAPYGAECEAIAGQFLAFGKASRVAIFKQDDGYGAAVQSGMEKALAKFDSRPVVIGSYQRNPKDVRAAVYDAAKAIASVQGVTAVAMGGVAGACAELITLLKSPEFGGIGKGLMYCSVSFVGTSAVAKCLAEADGAGGLGVCQVMPYPFEPGSKFVAGFLAAASAIGIQPSYGALEGYCSAKTLLKGAERCGDRLTRQGLVDALEAPIDLGGFALNFRPGDHGGSRFVELTVFDGRGQLRR